MEAVHKNIASFFNERTGVLQGLNRRHRRCMQPRNAHKKGYNNTTFCKTFYIFALLIKNKTG